jgi:hypothetical protein
MNRLPAWLNIPFSRAMRISHAPSGFFMEVKSL